MEVLCIAKVTKDHRLVAPFRYMGTHSKEQGLEQTPFLRGGMRTMQKKETLLRSYGVNE